MTKQHETQSRMEIARRYLDDARAAQQGGRLRDAAAAARACIESVLKAMLARTGPVPKTHDPHHALERFLATAKDLSEDERSILAELVQLGRSYGLVAHLELSYGDEERGLTPWDFAPPEKVDRSLRDAEAVIEKAARLCEDPPNEAGHDR